MTRSADDTHSAFDISELRADEHWRDLFTHRQLVALTTFSDLVQEARERVKRDALPRPASTTASRSTTAALGQRPTPMR